MKKDIKHYSDCAVHNEPAFKNGKCNCGGFKSPKPQTAWAVTYEGDKTPEIFQTLKEAEKAAEEYNYSVEIKKVELRIID